MLPHVHAKDGDKGARHGVLVLGRHDLQRLPVARPLSLDEPTPAAALDAQQLGRECLLEGLQAAPGLSDLVDEGRGRLLGLRRLGAGRRGQVLPEQGVVDVAAAVEVDGWLQCDLLVDVVGLGRCGQVGQGLVEVRDVGLMVLGVVELHDLLGDAGLERLRRRRFSFLSC